MIKMLLCFLLLFIPGYATAAIDWNDDYIAWHDYEEGVRIMKSEYKNGILIIYSDDCRVCVEYAKMFKNSDVIRNSKNVVMIKVHVGSVDSLPVKYLADGNYVPRTYMLDVNTNIIKSPYKNDKYTYFLPPKREKYLAELMRLLVSK